MRNFLSLYDFAIETVTKLHFVAKLRGFGDGSSRALREALASCSEARVKAAGFDGHFSEPCGARASVKKCPGFCRRRQNDDAGVLDWKVRQGGLKRMLQREIQRAEHKLVRA